MSDRLIIRNCDNIGNKWACLHMFPCLRALTSVREMRLQVRMMFLSDAGRLVCFLHVSASLVRKTPLQTIKHIIPYILSLKVQTQIEISLHDRPLQSGQPLYSIWHSKFMRTHQFAERCKRWINAYSWVRHSFLVLTCDTHTLHLNICASETLLQSKKDSLWKI